MLQAGIIGLPNVGKSTLFNALLRRQQALVANYPFATIEPNVGVIPVPDGRLTKLQETIGNETKDKSSEIKDRKMENGNRETGGIWPPIVPATMRFVDIAGLVKGAAEGAGLGNKFLSHIREVDLICEVVRAFPDTDVIREGSAEPKGDIETINTELILADLQTLERQESRKAGEKGAVKNETVQKLKTGLNKGKLASEVELSDEEKEAVNELQLLTAKKFIYVFNVNTASEWEGTQKVIGELEATGNRVVVIDAKLEAELAVLSPDEQEEYLASLGVKDSGVNSLIRTAYTTLGLISFLTAPDFAKASTGKGWEVRAWPIPAGTKAPQAAGTIHTDFEKGFIKAEVVDYNDFILYNGWQECRRLGKARIEGKDYLMKDGDVVDFKVNA